jgi:isoleucyl-tRNA synthetase
VTDALEGYDALRAAQALEKLVDDLSNWYVRRSRSRFWNADDDAAHATLHECLATVTRLLAPFCPFVADELHRIVGPATESVHLDDWPEADPTAIDPTLEAEMDVVRQLVSLGLSARMEAKIRVRQPLGRALVLPPPGTTLRAELIDEIADAFNVKSVEVITDLEGLIRYSVTPRFPVLGPKLGSLVNAVKSALAHVDGGTVRGALEREGRFELDVEGKTIELVPEDVEIRASSHDELVLAQDGAAAVALDTTLDDDLRLEGSARELVRALNDLRKTTGLAVTDRIRMALRAEPPVDEALDRHGKWIAGEVLATEYEVLDADPPEADGFVRIEIDGASVTVRIERVERD